jgi:2-methylcitrate dehydratase PrpD
MDTVAKKFAEFITETDISSFPPEVRHQATRCLFDTAGAILAGSRYSDSGQSVCSYAEKINEEKTSTIAGTLMQRSASTAALANGVMAHALELDDGSKHATYHPGSSIIPAVLALAERESSSGKSILEAIVLGYEVSLRIGMAVNPSHYLRGFHPTGTVAAFGTTAAACKILGLNKAQVCNALGLAGSLASGINQYEVDGSVVKHLHPGNAARNGILAAELAKEGFTGPEGVIEGRLGFCHCFADQFELEGITDKLGKDYAFLQIYFKPYCSCRYVHFAIEGTLNILNEHGLKADDIETVTVKTHKNGKQCSDIREFQTPLHARLSIQYGIASIIVRGSAGLMDYTEEKIKDPEVCELAKRMSIEVDPEIQKVYPNPRSMIVEIKTKGGKTWSSRVDYAKGDPKNPISDEELIHKFSDITGKLVDKPLRKKIFEEAMGLEHWESAESFMSLLRIGK